MARHIHYATDGSISDKVVFVYMVSRTLSSFPSNSTYHWVEVLLWLYALHMHGFQTVPWPVHLWWDSKLYDSLDTYLYVTRSRLFSSWEHCANHVSIGTQDSISQSGCFFLHRNRNRLSWWSISLFISACPDIASLSLFPSHVFWDDVSIIELPLHVCLSWCSPTVSFFPRCKS